MFPPHYQKVSCVGLLIVSVLVKWDHQVDEELVMIAIALMMLFCHELEKFYGRNEEVKIRCKTSGSPYTGLTDFISIQPNPKKEQVLFCPELGIIDFQKSKYLIPEI